MLTIDDIDFREHQATLIEWDLQPQMVLTYDAETDQHFICLLVGGEGPVEVFMHVYVHLQTMSYMVKDNLPFRNVITSTPVDIVTYVDGVATAVETKNGWEVPEHYLPAANAPLPGSVKELLQNLFMF